MKSIRIDAGDKTYRLEFTRKTVETMERQGFHLEDLADKPVTALPALFAGAFLSRHRYMKKEAIEEILRNTPNKHDIFEALATMYNDTVMSLMDDGEDEGKNVSWEKEDF